MRSQEGKRVRFGKPSFLVKILFLASIILFLVT